MTNEKILPPTPAEMPSMPPMPPMDFLDKKIQLPEIDFSNISLDWSQYASKWELSEDGSYFGLKFVYYCRNAVSPCHQYMNIYVPAAYLNSNGTVSAEGKCCGYTAKTAPIVLLNDCAGWKSSVPGGPDLSVLRAGFVFVFCGARSRDAENGKGKAPAPVIDEKAAVRFLRLHRDNIPGSTDKIVSCGTSGGGQMSSILGATGNMEWYFPYLYEIGAAGIERSPDGKFISTIPDNIYASQCYCPIADINNADLAYAWLRYDVGETGVRDMMSGNADFSPFQLQLQNDAAKEFCVYINTLSLKDENGNILSFGTDKDGTPDPRSGSYYEKTLHNISAGLNAWVKDKLQPDGSVVFVKNGPPFLPKETVKFASLDEYFASLKYTDKWLKKNDDGSYEVTDLMAFLCGTNLVRNKNIPGFDTFHRTAENDAFGARVEKAVHFSNIGRLMEKNYDSYKAIDGFDDCDVHDFIAESKRPDIIEQTYYMNATHIMLDVANGRQKSDIARHWRTRNGAADEHTSFSVAYNLCLSAKMAGADSIDYALIWGAPHGDVDGDGTGSFIGWVNDICR